MKKYISLSLFLILLVSLGCKKKQETKNTENQPEISKVSIPSFNEDSAFAFVEKQLNFGPRVPETKAHKDCKIWLVSKLKSFGAQVQVQEFKAKTFDGVIRKGYNIIGSLYPEKTSRIMLSAHWDSRPFADHDPDPVKRKQPVPAANDGASGVGVLLEVARILQQQEPPIGIDIFFWDLEDYGPPDDLQRNTSENAWGLGSQYWSQHFHIPGYNARYGVLLDMVGSANATFYYEGFSRQFAPSIQRKIWDIAHSLGFQNYFIKEEANPILDDHYFINTLANIPTVDIIHQDKTSKTGFYPYWHTTGDDLSKISKPTLKAVGQTLLQLIFSEKPL